MLGQMRVMSSAYDETPIKLLLILYERGHGNIYLSLIIMCGTH